MDLLKYGMENRKSQSAVRRRLAETALDVVKAKADMQESRIEKSGIELPEEPDAERMLDEIKARIKAEELKKKDSE